MQAKRIQPGSPLGFLYTKGVFEHYIQRDIIYRLAFSESLRFSELKPDILENKLFTYHLKKVVTAGYVVKNVNGLYELTPEGRRLGVRVLNQQNDLVNKAESVLFLIIRRQVDGAWLLYKRLTHPLINQIGFMHDTPYADVISTKSAKAVCYEKTGIKANFSLLGGGYFRVFEAESLESFTNFSLLYSEDATGELIQNDQHAKYFWQTEPDFNDSNMLPNMKTLVQLYKAKKPFFVEKTFHI